ncbi:unnamed protein product [Parnassius apollo]|uniref:(apollo) hypothetical protein n=1 Tax=Parnassius apollo TaxID=110799 RepID=A0A8S3YA73_PARAO|nr:unnamed protein product [Parnassius apollo]
MNMWKKYGKGNFRVQVGTEDWVFLSDADDIGIMLNHPTELGKPLERNTAFLPFFGNSVSTSEGERWRSTRKLLSPSFLYKTLENRIDVINVNTERLFNIFDDYVDKGSIDMYRYLRPFMFDILCDSLMGVNLNLLDNPDHHYLNASAKVIRIITHNYFSYWRNIRPLFVLTSLYREMMDTIKSLRDTSTEIMAKRRKKLQKIIEDTKIINENVHTEVEKIIEEKDDMCLLDKFILSKSIIGDSLPDEFINEEISLICFTGHYTTTMTVSHTLYCLAKYPEVQKRVYEEQMSVFDNDISRKLTHHDLSEMKYLEAVIKESIRVIPTVTKIGRQLKNDVVLKDGRIIPAGSSVIVFLEAMSVNPKVFSEPEEYNPDRFNNNIHQFAFVPFSAGPRGCIGN